MQNKLRVSYCNYSFVGEQRHPRTVGKQNAPSVWAFQACSLHGVGTLRHPKFLRCGGNQQDGKNCGNKAASCINLIECPCGSNRRASESGSPCTGVLVHTPEWGALPSWSRRAMSESLSWRGSRGAPFGEGTLSPLRRYLKPLPKGGRGGRGGVNEEPKPP